MDEDKYDVPMIEKHRAEMNEMHLIHTNSNIKWVAIIIAFVLAIAVVSYAISTIYMSKAMVEQSKLFIDNYTSRTDKWLSTLLQMQNGYPNTEVLNEKVQTGNVQQLPIP